MGGVEDFFADSTYDLASLIGFTCSAFIASTLLTISGFGHGILSSFIFQMFQLAGLMNKSCDIKFEVFVQTVAASSTTLVIVIRAFWDFFNYLDYFLLSVLLPATFLGTPVGDWLLTLLSVSIIEIVAGTVLLCFCAYTAYVGRHKLALVFGRCFSCCGSTSSKSAADVKEPLLADEPSTPTEDEEIVADIEEAAVVVPESYSDGFSSGYTPCKITVKETAFAQPTPVTVASAPVSDKIDSYETWKAKVYRDFAEADWRVGVAGFVAAFLGGLLGGLTGCRAPPVILFFVISGHAKSVVRSSGLAVGMVNLAVRLVYYAAIPGEKCLRRTTGCCTCPCSSLAWPASSPASPSTRTSTRTRSAPSCPSSSPSAASPCSCRASSMRPRTREERH